MILYRIVGVLYMMSGCWCLLRPELAAVYVGFSWSQSTALAEFVAVYGGLQIGIALSVFYTSISQHSIAVGVKYTLILSISLLTARLFGLWQHGSNAELLVMLLIEAAIVVSLLLSLRSISATKQMGDLN